jgi:phenylalanyl-tRNA synthetase alpha chain
MNDEIISASNLISLLIQAQEEALATIRSEHKSEEELRILLLGAKSEFSRLTKQIGKVPKEDRQKVGLVVTEVKQSIEDVLSRVTSNENRETNTEWFDKTQPGIRPPEGHLHIITQAIMEITHIFEKIGFTRVRYPEIDWDYYAFESLNMPANHPARDEWETFFIENPLSSRSAGKRSGDPIGITASPSKTQDPRNDSRRMVLTPHTSNGQVREMEKKNLPIRMINIAKCYRRQIDVSHTPMFHQFEGMYIDKNVSIAHLIGVCNYFAQQFFGPNRKIRLRPFHFQFTEPSFEVDINCGICFGSGKLKYGDTCRLCKSGWLELGGAGMVHPNVLRNGGVDPTIYSGFAFGWGIERTSMMKSGTKLDDIRLLYSNDLRFLNQF